MLVRYWKTLASLLILVQSASMALGQQPSKISRTYVAPNGEVSSDTSRLQTIGSVDLSARRLAIGSQAGIEIDVTDSADIELDFFVSSYSLDTTNQFKLQTSFSVESGIQVIIQLITDETQPTTILIAKIESGQGVSLREYITSEPMAQNWRLRSSHGYVTVAAETNLVAEFDADIGFSQIVGASLALARGSVELSSLTTENYSPRIEMLDADSEKLRLAEDLVGTAAQARVDARYREAEAAARQALELYQDILGTDSYQALVVRQNLATYIMQNRNLPEAREFLEQGLILAEQKYTELHPVYFSMQLSLSHILSLLNDDARALELAEKVFDRSQSVYGPDSYQTQSAFSNYAALLEQNGLRADALKLREENLLAAANKQGWNDFHLISGLQAYLESAVVVGELQRADFYFDKLEFLLSEYADFLNADRTARFYRLKGDYVFAKGNGDEAIKFYETARTEAIQNLGPGHEAHAIINNSLTQAHLALEQYPEAIGSASKALSFSLNRSLDVLTAASEFEANQFVSSLYRTRDRLLVVSALNPEFFNTRELYGKIRDVKRVVHSQLAARRNILYDNPTEEVSALVSDLNTVKSLLSGFIHYDGVMSSDPRVFSLIDIFQSEKGRLERELLSTLR